MLMIKVRPIFEAHLAERSVVEIVQGTDYWTFPGLLDDLNEIAKRRRFAIQYRKKGGKVVCHALPVETLAQCVAFEKE